MTKQELKEQLDAAVTERINAHANYNKTWRDDPTAKGYPKVDKALARLQEAERQEAHVRELIANAT